jgi:phage tail sheath gpL-like
MEEKQLSSINTVSLSSSGRVMNERYDQFCAAFRWRTDVVDNWALAASAAVAQSRSQVPARPCRTLGHLKLERCIRLVR